METLDNNSFRPLKAAEKKRGLCTNIINFQSGFFDIVMP